MFRAFQFPDKFLDRGSSGSILSAWTNIKDDISAADVLVVVSGGNSLCPRPSDPLHYKETIRSVIGQFTQLRNYCNMSGTRLLIMEIINRESSMRQPLDPINVINSRLETNKLRMHFRRLNFQSVLARDNVHLTNTCYILLAEQIVEVANTAPEARPDLVDKTLQPLI